MVGVLDMIPSLLGSGGKSSSSSSSSAVNTTNFNPFVNISTAPTTFTPSNNGTASSSASPTSTASASGNDGTSWLDSLTGSLPITQGRLSPNQIPYQPINTTTQPAANTSGDMTIPLLLGGGALLMLMND